MNSGKPSTYKRVSTPGPVRLLNAIARPLQRISDQTVSLEAGNLLDTASGRTHLADWGHPSARQALDVMLDSVRREGKLMYFGRFTLRQFLIGKLCNRLRIIEALKRFPAIDRQPIRRPAAGYSRKTTGSATDTACRNSGSGRMTSAGALPTISQHTIYVGSH